MPVATPGLTRDAFPTPQPQRFTSFLTTSRWWYLHHVKKKRNQEWDYFETKTVFKSLFKIFLSFDVDPPFICCNK
jgi:hypothetical protein